MPRGYPDTVTCKECETGQPADFQYCPDCGAKLPRPRWETRKQTLILPFEGKRGQGMSLGQAAWGFRKLI